MPNSLQSSPPGVALRMPTSNPTAKHQVREYDILKTSTDSDQGLFFVAKRDNIHVAIRLERSLLPEDALPLLKRENVRTHADFLRIYGLSYGDLNIHGIRVNNRPLYFMMDERKTYEPGNFDYNRVFGLPPHGFSFSRMT